MTTDTVTNLTLSLNLSLTDLEWEAEFREFRETELTEMREGIQLSDFSATIEEFREDRRHLSDPAYSIILLCYFLVLILAGLLTFSSTPNPYSIIGWGQIHQYHIIT